MRRSAFKSIAVLAAYVIFSPSISHAQSPTCKALVKIGNDLWFAQSDGNIVSQLTNDGQMKYATAISPNGKVIAYSGKPSPADVTLIDQNGTLLTDVNVSAKDAITSVEWLSPNMLKIGEHSSPTSSRYFFATVPTDPFKNAIKLVAPASNGGNCAVSANGKDTVCFESDLLMLNARHIYTLSPSSLASTQIQSADVVVGTSMLTTTDPQFRIEIKGIEKSLIHLRIVPPGGDWQETYAKDGEAVELLSGEDTSDSDSVEPRYSVIPKLTHDSRIVSLSIVKSQTGKSSFEAGPVWDPRGKRIAFVEADEAGNRSLVLINREMGNAAIAGSGALDARIKLPLTSPVKYVRFSSDTHLILEGSSTKLEMDIPAQGKVPGNVAFQVTSAMPSTINIQSAGTAVSTDVIGWSCH